MRSARPGTLSLSCSPPDRFVTGASHSMPKSELEVPMSALTHMHPAELEMPFFLAVVAMTYFCGLLLIAQFL